MVVGDGGVVFALERRGYVNGGIWTPEVVMEHPEAGKLSGDGILSPLVNVAEIIWSTY